MEEETEAWTEIDTTPKGTQLLPSRPAAFAPAHSLTGPGAGALSPLVLQAAFEACGSNSLNGLNSILPVQAACQLTFASNPPAKCQVLF